MATSENKGADLSWLIIPFVVFCLCIPAMLPTFQSGH